jgi:hypothetical protein
MQNNKENEGLPDHIKKNEVIDSDGNVVPPDQLPLAPEGYLLNEEEVLEQFKHLDPNPVELNRMLDKQGAKEAEELEKQEVQKNERERGV